MGGIDIKLIYKLMKQKSPEIDLHICILVCHDNAE